MNIYKITIDNTVTEFVSLQEATSYAINNNISLDHIMQEERQIVGYVEDLPTVTPRQIRQALILSGVTMEEIEASLNALTEPIKTLAKIEWEYASYFDRNRDLVKAVQAELEWTDKQVNDLWKLAASL